MQEKESKFWNTKIDHDLKLEAWNTVNGTSMANRGKFDGDAERQYTGVLGELVFAQTLDIPFPNYKTKGFDNGIDFVVEGMNVDIKTMGRECYVHPSFVCDVVAPQLKYDTHVYLFASINKKTGVLELIGWIEKDAIKGKFGDIELFPKGSSRRRRDGTTFKTPIDMYEIPIEGLTKFSSPSLFTMEMEYLANNIEQRGVVQTP